MYINDIINVSSELFPILFADDSNEFLIGKDPNELIEIMNGELKKLLLWLYINKLTLNIKKTQFMIFCPPRKKPDISVALVINDETINQVIKTKFLGVIIDADLKWNFHINYISAKIAKGIGVISKARKYLNKDSLITLYYSFVYPYLNYCIEVWGKCAACHLSSLLKLQKKIIRIACGSHRLDHTEPLFKALHILPLRKLYQFRVGMFMFKYNKHDLPPVFDNLYTINNEIHQYSTRLATRIHIPKVRTNLLKHTIRYAGAIIWNHLYNVVPFECSLDTYRKRLKYYNLTNDLCINV